MNASIIDKVRKLIAHERSARKIGSFEEAAAFAGRIQQLLLDHKLSMSEIELADERQPRVGQEVHFTTRERIPFKKRDCWWYRSLLNTVASGLFCRTIGMAGYNIIYVIGREDDRAVTLAMFEYLLATMKRLASAERKAHKRKRRSVRNYTSSFYRGFIGAVAYRFSGLREESTQSNALVLASDAEVDAFAQAHHPDTFLRKRPQFSRINHEGRLRGSVHGRQVSLASNVVSSGREPKLLLPGDSNE